MLVVVTLDSIKSLMNHSNETSMMQCSVKIQLAIKAFNLSQTSSFGHYSKILSDMSKCDKILLFTPPPYILLPGGWLVV